MGTPGAPGKIASNPVTVMDEEKITPYRMNQIVQTAAKVTEMIVNGKYLYKPNFEECELVLDFVRHAIEKSKEE